MDGWNTIATAPKDGTVILMHNPEEWGGPIRGYWDGHEWAAETRPMTLGPSRITDPTHWLPVAGHR